MPAHFPAAVAPELTASAQHMQDSLHDQQPQHTFQIDSPYAQTKQQALQQQQRQQPSMAQELQQLAQLSEPKFHWLAVVLGIGVVNVLGLQAVLKLLQASKDSKWLPCLPA